MTPVSRKALASKFFLNSDLSIIPAAASAAKITGSVKKLGEKYQDATIVLYNKGNLQPIAIQKPDANGSYRFSGLNTSLNTFIVAFDQKQQYNAVTQDNVVPK